MKNSGTVTLSYFPGCSAHATAVDQERSTRALCEALEIRLEELQDWNCCGATAAHTIGGHLVERLGSRNLDIAEKSGRDLLVPCASCFGNLRRAADERKGASPLEILSIPALFCRPEMRERIRDRIVTPLEGLPIAAYYGCLLVRPGTTGADNPENPMEIDHVISLCGGIPVPWSFKTECCGGAHTVSHPETVTALSDRIVDMARRVGAAMLVTACPMCHSALETGQWEARKRVYGLPLLPVLFVTELVAVALAIPKQGRWLKRHLINPIPFLEKRGLLP